MFGRYSACLVVSLVVAGAALLRFFGLTRESLWNDELSTMARLLPGPFSERYWEMIFSDCHPPGYLLFLSAWTGVFGNSEVSLRLPSAIAGSVTPLAVFFLGRRIFGTSAGVAAAILAAVSPLLLRYSQEARSFAGVTLLTVVFAHQLFNLLVTSSKPGESARSTLRRALLPIVTSGILGATCAYVHYSGLLVVLTLGAFAWGAAIGFSRNVALPLAAASLLFLLCYLPWLGGLTTHLAQGGLPWLDRPTLADLKGVFGLALPEYTFPLVLATIALGTVQQAPRPEQAPPNRESRTPAPQARLGAALLLWWVIVLPLGFFLKSLSGAPIYSARNLLVVVPPTLVLVGGALARIPRRWVLPSAALLGVLVLCDTLFIQEFYSTPNKQDFRGAAAAALDLSAEGEGAAIVCYAWSKQYFAYYLERQRPGLDLRCSGDSRKVLGLLRQRTKPGETVVLAYAHKIPDATLRRKLTRDFTIESEVRLHKAGALLLKRVRPKRLSDKPRAER